MHDRCTTVAQLLQPSLAFCFSLQPMTAYRPGYAVIGCKLKQNANEGCNSCASLAGVVLCFIACFILLVIAPLRQTGQNNYHPRSVAYSVWYCFQLCLFVTLSVCPDVCLSVNTITPKPLEISSPNFRVIILWRKGRPSSKMVIKRCAGGEKRLWHTLVQSGTLVLVR